MNDNKELIFKLYKEDGLSASEIGKKFDICQQPICNFFRANNVEIRYEPYNKHDIDESYFETMNHEAAYYLGYLFSDGFLVERYDRIGMNLSVKDECVLQEFKKCLKSEHTISHRPPKNSKIKTEKGYQIVHSGIISCFRFENKKIADDLRKFGMKGRKSLTLEWPKIEEKYYYSFLRGYIDGDGCIYVGKTGKATLFLLGSKDFTNSLVEFIHKDTGIYLRRIKQGNIYRVLTNNRTNILAILNKIYKDNDGIPRLERKYKKYLILQESVEKRPIQHKFISRFINTPNIDN